MLPRFSISLGSTHVDNGPTRMIERAGVAHRAGFASLTIGDHHDMPVPYAQNAPMLGRLLAEWADRPAGCLFLMPLWHPLLMAEQIGTLATIHQHEAPGQPFIIQTGLGRGEEQFINMGADIGTRGRFVERAIPIVKALLAGEHVDDDHFGLHAARVGLRAETTYEWWVGGAVGVSVDRAARFGDAWYAGPGASESRLAENIERYRSAGGQRVIVRIDAALMANHDDAVARATDLVTAGYRGQQLDQLLVGSPESVAERASEFAALGVDELTIRCAAAEQEHALETLELMGDVIGG